MIRRLTRTLRVADGAMRAYVARPDASDAPAVVVLHGAEGLDDAARASCDALAALGYLAVCPDLFWRQDERAAGARSGDASAALRDFDRARAAIDVAETVEAIRRETLAHQGVAVLGRGLEGLLAALADARLGIGAPLLAVEAIGLLVESGTETRSCADERLLRLIERRLGPGIASNI